MSQGITKKKIPIPSNNPKNQQVRFHYDVTVAKILSWTNENISSILHQREAKSNVLARSLLISIQL